MDQFVYLYPWSIEEAKKRDQMDMWRESHKENCSCARAIEEAIKNGYHDNSLDDNIVKTVIEQFGYDRVNHVLANTVKEYSADGRISQENKEWAQGFYIPKSEHNWHMAVSSHPGLTNIFINQARREWQELGLFDQKHCLDGLQNYTDKVVVVKGFYLNDEYKQSDFQLMYADGGNGCNPQARGTTVFGYFLKDGERCSFDRSQIHGVLKEEYLPEWAAEKLYPPLRSVIAAPDSSAEIIMTSAYTGNVKKLLDAERIATYGLLVDEGSFNVLYDEKAQEQGKPFNRTLYDMDLYGSILINGMNETDISLTEEQAEHFVALLNEPSIEETQEKGVNMGGIQ